MERETKSETLLLRISPKLKAAAQKAADADKRKLSDYVHKALEEHLIARGFLKRNDK